MANTVISDPDLPDPHDKGSATDFIKALDAKMEKEIINRAEAQLTQYWLTQAHDVAMIFKTMKVETGDIELSRKITEMYVSVALMKQAFPPPF